MVDKISGELFAWANKGLKKLIGIINKYFINIYTLKIKWFLKPESIFAINIIKNISKIHSKL